MNSSCPHAKSRCWHRFGGSIVHVNQKLVHWRSLHSLRSCPSWPAEGDCQCEAAIVSQSVFQKFLENTLTFGGSRLRFSVIQIIFKMQLRIHPDNSKYAGLPPWKRVCIFECVVSQCPANATMQLCKHDVLQQESSLALYQYQIIISCHDIKIRNLSEIEIIPHLWTTFFWSNKSTCNEPQFLLVSSGFMLKAP